MSITLSLPKLVLGFAVLLFLATRAQTPAPRPMIIVHSTPATHGEAGLGWVLLAAAAGALLALSI